MRRLTIALLGIVILLVANAVYLATLPLRVVGKVWDDMKYQYADFLEHSFHNMTCVYDFLSELLRKEGGDA